MKEFYYDKLLNIKTRGTEQAHAASGHHNPYEPTPYHALETLFQNYRVQNCDHIVDFGCGKGRFLFYTHYFYQAAVTGIEMNRTLLTEAIKNRYRYGEQMIESDGRIAFHCCLAEDYPIDPADNRFYFFNPFSLQVFKQVIHNVLCSKKQYERDIELIVYYASDAYIHFLETETAFEWQKDILLPDISHRDTYEKFKIYQLAG